MLFFLALILYIFSVVSGLVIFITIKNIPSKVLITGAVIHFLFLLMFLFYFFTRNLFQALPLIFPLSLLFYCCSGLVLAGMTMHTHFFRWLKYYSILFIITFPVFIIKPSGLIHFLLDMQIKKEAATVFRIKDNMELHIQPTVIAGDTTGNYYKLVLKHGFFTQTLKRDIVLEHRLDSVRAISVSYPGNIILSGYYTDSGGNADSMEIIIPDVKKK